MVIAKHTDKLEKHNRFLEDMLTKKAKHMEDTVGSLEARIADLESFRNSANETLANAFSESREHEEQNATLREALEWYAEPLHKDGTENFDGARASHALEATKEGE